MRKLLLSFLCFIAVLNSHSQVFISGFLTNPAGTDAPYEYTQFVATQAIDFSVTNYSVVWCNNGTATSNGWAAGAAISYKFNITSGSVARGETFYVGGSGKLINGSGSTDISSANWVKTINTGTTVGDGLGSANTSGSLGNGGTADGIAIFNTTTVTASTVPVDAIFFGTAIGGAKPTTGGYTVPTNDRYDNTQGTYGNGTNTYFFTDASTTGQYIRMVGAYNTSAGTWTSARFGESVSLTSSSVLTDITPKIALTNATVSYYSKSTGDLRTLINWTTASDGSGSTSPSNFTNPNALFVINNRPGITSLTGDLTIAGILIVNAGHTLATSLGARLVLTSNAANTARIGTSFGAFFGDYVTVERYIPAGNRAYRFLSPSVTTANFIKDNWQEGTNNPNTSTNNNPNAGYGTHISGSATGVNGFDATVTGNPSLFQFNNTAQTWGSIANTDATALTVGNAYRILIRGNRAVDLNAAAAPSNTATTLRATGALLSGTVTMNSTGAGATSGMPLLSAVVGNYSFVGNPYASPVNWDNVYASSTGLEDYYYTWDPTRSLHGAYVYWDRSDATNGGSAGSAVNQDIQPGQAIFVRSSSVTPVLTFNETHKSFNSASNGTFRTQTTLTGKLTIGLTNAALLASNNGFDGANIVFADNFSAAIDGEDIPKMNNQDENLSVYSNAINLMKEARPSPAANDTVQLRVWQLASNSYILTFDAQQFAGNKEAYLLDGYLNTVSPISIAGNTQYPFTTNAAAASFADTRFRIVFRTTGTLPVSITSLKAFQKNAGVQVEWNTVNEMDMVSYEVEKSIDGSNFSKAGTVAAIGASAYNWFDASPVNGSNFYRIKMIDKNGTAKFTQMVNVRIGSVKNTFTIVGNPVKNKTVTVQLENVDKGSYTLTVFNNLGQQVASRTINHAGGSATDALSLGNVSTGSYQLSITGTNGLKVIKTILVD